MRWWGVATEWRKETEVLVACAKKNQVGGNSGAVLTCGRKEGRRLDATLPFKNSGRFPPPPYVGKGRGKGGPLQNVVPLPEAIFNNRGKENFPELTKNSAFA